MGRHAAPGSPDDDLGPTEPAPAALPDPGPTSPDHHPLGLVASLVLGLVAALAAGGVLWWAGKPVPVAATAAGLALAVVVAAAWVARAAARHHALE